MVATLVATWAAGSMLRSDLEQIYSKGMYFIIWDFKEGIMAGTYGNCYKGREYNMQAGVAEAALHMFTNGVNIEFIQAITGLSAEKIKTLNKDNFYHFASKNPLLALMYTEDDEVKSLEADLAPMPTIRAGVKVAIEVVTVELLKEKYGVKVTSKWFDSGMETGMKQVTSYMIKCGERTSFH